MKRKGRKTKEKELQIHSSPEGDHCLSQALPQAPHLGSNLRCYWCLQRTWVILYSLYPTNPSPDPWKDSPLAPPPPLALHAPHWN